MLPHHVRELLKQLGLRSTVPRSLVIEALLTLNRPVSHHELAELIPESEIDLSTIFRNLVLLADAGLVRRMELGDRIWRYEWIGVPTTEYHPHFVCTQCGQIRCLTESESVTPSLATANLLIEEVVLRGLCPNCRKSSEPLLD